MPGILSNSPMGILDPRSAAIAQMGLSLMSQGPSRTPVSLGASLGQAGMQGMQAFQQAQQANREEELRQLKLRQIQEEMRLAQQQASLPPKPVVASPGSQFVNPVTGEVMHTVPFKPEDPKPPAAPLVRDFREGDQVVTKQYVNGEWKELSRGAAFAPKGSASGPSMLPKPPTGYRYNAEGTALEAIPGGPKDTTPKDRARIETAKSRADLVMGKVDEALKNVGFTTTGLVGSVLGKIPGTDAYDLRKTVDTIKANIGFQELQAMREMSPTGGALGQVAVQELNMLQSVLSSLDEGQSEEQLSASLQAIKQHFENWKATVARANAEQPAQSFPQPPADAIRRLRMNPKEAEQFDEVFGPGAAARVLKR